VGKHL